MEDISSETLSQLSLDELAEVLEELTGIEFDDSQAMAIQKLIEAAGSLQAALDMLEQINPDDHSAEAA